MVCNKPALCFTIILNLAILCCPSEDPDQLHQRKWYLSCLTVSSSVLHPDFYMCAPLPWFDSSETLDHSEMFNVSQFEYNGNGWFVFSRGKITRRMGAIFDLRKNEEWTSIGQSLPPNLTTSVLFKPMYVSLYMFEKQKLKIPRTRQENVGNSCL